MEKPMNRLTPSLIGEEAFEAIRNQIFDDFNIVEEDYNKHSETFVLIQCSVDQDAANAICSLLKNHKVDCSKLAGLKASFLVGDWLANTSKTYNDGVDTDSIDEMYKGHKVTETISVTSWKPLNVEQEACPT